MSDLQVYLRDKFSEFSNPSRLQSLYSDFSSAKVSNPYGYNANVQFWKKVLIHASKDGYLSMSTTGEQGDILIFSIMQLKDRLEWNGLGKPLGLESVVEELKKSKEIISLSYFALQYHDDWPGWLFTKLVKSPIAWAMERLPWSQTDESYVITATLTDAANKILSHQHATATYPIADNLMEFVDFKKKFSSLAGHGHMFTDADLHIVVRFLEHEKKVIVTGSEDDLILKFKRNDNISQRLEITKTDRGIVNIKRVEKMIEVQINDIEGKITTLDHQIKSALQTHRKTVALQYLHRKKALALVLDKRLNSLSIVSAIILKIQSAEADAEIIAAYDLGADTLRDVIRETGLDADMVEGTMDKVVEALADQKEVEDAMVTATNGFTAVDIDEDDLEAELQKLVIGAETLEQERETPLKVPTVIEQKPVNISIDEATKSSSEKVVIAHMNDSFVQSEPDEIDMMNRADLPSKSHKTVKKQEGEMVMI